jgi:menaquinone-dependent protoporphyrinogen oxidase
MKVLITYGSKMGGTAELADMMAAALRDLGLQAEVHPVFLADHVEAFDAVVVGSALYMQRWRRDARRFVERNTELLRERPVFFFSDPLDDGTDQMIPPTKQTDRLLRRVGGVGHTMFGGRLPGNRRDRGEVIAWANGVATFLVALQRRVGA